MDAIDKMLDNIQILLNRLEDNEYKKQLNSEYEKLRNLFENMKTKPHHEVGKEIHLMFGKTDNVFIIEKIVDLEMAINIYMKNGERVALDTSDVRKLDLDKPNLKLVKIYSEALDSFNSNSSEEEKISFIEKIEEDLKKYDIYSQEIDQKIASKKYEIIVSLIKQGKHEEANKIINTLGTDMEIFISHRFNTNNEEILSSGNLGLIERMTEYIQENQNNGERNISFWMNTIVPMERVINKEPPINEKEEEEEKEEDVPTTELDQPKKGLLKSFFETIKSKFSRKGPNDDMKESEAIGILVRNDEVEEEKTEEEKTEEEKTEEEKTEEEKTEEEKTEEDTEEQKDKIIIDEDITKRYLEAEQMIINAFKERNEQNNYKWLEKRKKARIDLENRLNYLKSTVKEKRQNNETVIEENKEIEVLKRKYVIEYRYIKQYKLLGRYRKEIKNLYEKLKNEALQNSENIVNTIEEVEKKISEYQKAQELLGELETKIIEENRAENEKREAEEEAERQRRKIEEQKRLEEERKRQEQVRKMKEIDGILLRDRQEKNKLKKECLKLLDEIEEKRKQGINTEEEEAKYKILKEKYEQARASLKERENKMREEALGIKNRQEDQTEREFSARDIAEAGLGASEKDCLKANKEIDEIAIKNREDYSIE